jgi:GNAT superfamily N-acetyltransferase
MSSGIEVRKLTVYSPEDAAAIGVLTPFVNETHDGSPIPEDVLTNIIESDRSDQFVAERQGTMVGAMTLNLLVTTTARKAYLDNLVVHPDAQREGVGHALWLAAEAWCGAQNARVLDFLSPRGSFLAHDFYRAQGVEKLPSLTPWRAML